MPCYKQQWSAERQRDEYDPRHATSTAKNHAHRTHLAQKQYQLRDLYLYNLLLMCFIWYPEKMTPCQQLEQQNARCKFYHCVVHTLPCPTIVHQVAKPAKRIFLIYTYNTRNSHANPITTSKRMALSQTATSFYRKITRTNPMCKQATRRFMRARVITFNVVATVNNMRIE